MINLNDVQKRLAVWQKQNFPSRELTQTEQHMLQMALGINEEAGEIAHAVLKGSQKIRLESCDNYDTDAIIDGCMDCLIYSMQLLSILNVDIEMALLKVTNEIYGRDWIKFPYDGVSK